MRSHYLMRKAALCIVGVRGHLFVKSNLLGFIASNETLKNDDYFSDLTAGVMIPKKGPVCAVVCSPLKMHCFFVAAEKVCNEAMFHVFKLIFCAMRIKLLSHFQRKLA